MSKVIYKSSMFLNVKFIYLLSLFKINAFWAPFTEKMRRGCSQPTLISTIEVSQCTSPQICTESSSLMGDGSVRDDIIG